MKNKKLLVGLLSASSIAMTLPAIASCSKHNNVNEPEVSSKTPKERAVGTKATRTYFLIKQGNIDNPEDTKVKIVNLKVNGADAKSVSGLIKSSADSAGNILVIFNMSIAQKQYQAETITFDLKLTNKTANTEYTVTGFSVTVSYTASAVEYDNVTEGVNLTHAPDSTAEDEDLEIDFNIKPGYEWVASSPNEQWDVLVGDDETSIKEDILNYQTQLGVTLVSISDDPSNESYIIVPQTLIPTQSTIKIVLKADGSTYDIDHSGASLTQHIKYTGEDTVKHPNNYTATIEPENAYYAFNPSSDTWDVEMNGTSLKDTGKATFGSDKKTLTVAGEAIVGDLTITATASKAKYQVTPTFTSHLTGMSSTTLTYNTDFDCDLSISSEYYNYSATVKCTDAISGSTTTIPGTGWALDQINKKFHIDGQYVTGPISIVFAEDGFKYDTSIVNGEGTETEHFTYDSSKIGTDKAQYGTPYTIEITPNDYYTLDNSRIGVKCNGASLTSPTDYNYVYDSGTKKGTLTISGTSIKGAIEMTVTPKANEYTYSAMCDAGFKTLTPTEGTATYNKDLVLTYTLEAGKQVDESAVECVVASSPTETLKINDGITHDSTNHTFTIAGSRIKGNLEFKAWSKDIVYSVSLGSTHTGIASLGTLSPTSPTYHKALTIPFNMTSGYVIDEEDFAVPAAGGDANIKVVMGGTKTLEAGVDFSVNDDNSITILENKLEGNIEISGVVKHYKTTVSQTGFTAASQDITYKYGEAVNINATLASGFSTPSAVITCNGGDPFTLNTDYTVTVTNNTSVAVKLTADGAKKVTAPLEITLTAVDTTVTFDTPFQDTIVIGDTSAETYTAKASTGQDAVVTKESGPDGTSLNQDGTITAGANAGKVELLATYQGATKTAEVDIVDAGLSINGGTEIEIGKTLQLEAAWTNEPVSTKTLTWQSSNATMPIDQTGKITLDGAVEDDTTTITLTAKWTTVTLTKTITVKVVPVKTLSVSGTHHLDVDNSTGITLTAKYGTETVTAKWTTTSGLISVDESTGVVTPTSAGQASGGSATVTCTYESETPVNFEIELASWSKITVSEISSGSGKYQVERNQIKEASEITGALILPSKYYGSAGTSTGGDVTEIQKSGFSYTKITSVVISDSITAIRESAFEDSDQYHTLKTVTIGSNSQLQIIEQLAFYKQVLEGTITFPSTLKKIGQNAFFTYYAGKTLTGIKFSGSNTWFHNGTAIDVTASEEANAENLQNGDWRSNGGIYCTPINIEFNGTASTFTPTAGAIQTYLEIPSNNFTVVGSITEAEFSSHITMTVSGWTKGTIAGDEITLGTAHTISYDATNNEIIIKLALSGSEAVTPAAGDTYTVSIVLTYTDTDAGISQSWSFTNYTVKFQ